MESRSEHSPPEEGWNAQYYTTQPPRTEASTQDANQAAGVGTTNPLCVTVCSQLQALLENDGSVRPEAATALYGHVAICPHCARQLEEMQRVVNMLEAMPLVELPRDYSPLVMRRLNVQGLSSNDVATTQTTSLCDRVRERLQPLLEKDPGISPDLATNMYGHLAVCADCAAEFSQMRRMVNLLETMPAAELPIDYSTRVMQRIQSGQIASPAANMQASRGPTSAVSSSALEGAATHETRATTSVVRAITLNTSATETRKIFLQRMITSVAMIATFIYMLASDWGRQVLGVNIDAARSWLGQIGENLERVPLLGPIIVSLTAALANIDQAIGHTFAALGGIAAQTLALECTLCMAAFILIGARRGFSATRI